LRDIRIMAEPFYDAVRAIWSNCDVEI